MEKVTELKGSMELLESQLGGEQHNHAIVLIEKEDEVAQLREEVSRRDT